MVEVFKTNITCGEIADTIVAELQLLFPHCAINFDLEDCDKILRIKGEEIYPARIVTCLHNRGYICQLLE